MIASWARRSLAADTIRIALVICCVFSTVRIRRLISFWVAIPPPLLDPAARPEDVRELVERLGERLLLVRPELAGLRDLVEQALLLGAHPREHLLLVATDVREVEVAHPALAPGLRRRGVDRDHLLGR